MSEITRRAVTLRAMLQGSLATRYPALLRKPVPIPPVDRTAIALGSSQASAPILLPQRARMEHMHVIGTTGGGKSKFYEHCIRQDIARGCGVLMIDPHGEHPNSLYRSVLAWLDQKRYAARRTIHLIDPNAPTHTVGFNPLARPDADTDISVIAGVTLEAFSKAWGGEDTTQKPTIERVLTATFAALAELGLTLVEAPFLLDRRDAHGLRSYAIQNVTDRYTRDELKRLHELSLDERRRHDFDLEIVGPVNRLARFLRPTAIRAMIGQTARVLDIREAMDDGHVILCNLSGGARVYEADADLLGRLLTRFCFYHAKRRMVPERPFFVYLDECHRYLSGDLENILAEARKYGLSAVLAHQWQRQLGSEDDNMLAAVRNATNIKVVFRIKDPEEAERLAQAVVPLDLEMPVRALVKPTVVGHRLVTLNSESTGESHAQTESRSDTRGRSISETESYSTSVGESVAHGSSITKSNSLSSGESISAGQSRSLSIGVGVSAGINSSVSETRGTSQSNSVGTGAGRSYSETMLPLKGDLFETPTVLSRNAGSNSTTSSSHASGVSSARSSALGMSATTSASRSNTASASTAMGSTRSRTAGISTGTNVTQSETLTSTEGYAVSRGSSHAITIGSAHTRGTSCTAGKQEAFEPLYADLPTAVHSKENVVYLAAQTLRNLATGTAFINYVGSAGMVPALLTVPRISEYPLSAEAFAALRERMLSASSAAIPIADATRLVAERERMLLAKKTVEEMSEPESFRTRAPLRPAAQRDHSPPAAAGRVPARSSVKARRSVR